MGRRAVPLLSLFSFQSYNSGPNNWWHSKHKNLIRCHAICLKKIVFKTYCGTKSQVSFLTFFVLNAKELELMTLFVSSKYYNEEFLEEQRRKLQMEKRASGGARVHFTTERCLSYFLNFERVHDLEIDPFLN